MGKKKRGGNPQQEGDGSGSQQQPQQGGRGRGRGRGAGQQTPATPGGAQQQERDQGGRRPGTHPGGLQQQPEHSVGRGRTLGHSQQLPQAPVRPQEVQMPTTVLAKPAVSQSMASNTDQTVQAQVPQPIKPPQQQVKEPRTNQDSGATPKLAPTTDAFTIATRKRPSGPRPGRQTRVETNHMALAINTPSNKKVIHYDVSITPDRPKRLLRAAVNEFLRIEAPNRFAAYDGMKNMYSCGYLPFGQAVGCQVTVRDDERNNVAEFTVEVREVNQLDFSLFRTYGANGNFHMPREYLQALDVIFLHVASEKFIKVRRSFFSPPQGQVYDLGHGVECWHGVFQSTIMGWKPFINVDVAHKGFAKAQNILDLIRDLFGDPRRGPVDFNGPLSAANVQTLKQYLYGLKIDYQIPGQPSTKRTYVFRAVKDCADKLSFKLDQKEGGDGGGRSITVARYFQETKAYPLKFPKMPCLHVGSPQRNIWLPVELCSVSAAQPVLKKLNEVQTSNMIKQAVTPADVRKRRILEAFKKLGLDYSPGLQEFQISVSEKLETVGARVLSAPSLQYGRERKLIVKNETGHWRADREHFLNPAQVKKWALLKLDKYCNEKAACSLVAMLEKNGKECGMSFEGFQGVYDARPYQQDISHKLESLKKAGCELCVCVVPDRGDAYPIVKQEAELKWGLLTQCVKSTTVQRKLNMATVNNLLLKINAKLDGVNHTLHTESKPPCLKRPVMIMGADVTHPSPDSKTEPSVAAVTASHDPKAFKYNIEWRLQGPRVEIIQDLEAVVKIQLRFFFKQTGFQPERIIFYRDGVGDSQFLEVLNYELGAIRRACHSLNPNYKPLITFLVVQKRHHTRLFPIDPRDKDGKNGNVPPGLVVDTEITQPTGRDFYLVSHASLLGTARPTKYQVLWDDANMTDDEVEHLTYYLCHLFTRCTRSVSYPAPTYYAHLAAFRAKVYLDGCDVDLSNLQQAQESRMQEIAKMFNKEVPMFFV